MCRLVRPCSYIDRLLPLRPRYLFRWHERPEALLDLIPARRWARIENRTGGLRDGGRVTFSIGIGPLRYRWEARHFGYIEGRRFCDEQVRGPFAIWRHTHLVEPIDSSRSLYEDRVEYSVRGGRLVNVLAAPLVRPLLRLSFARRHKIVRDSTRYDGPKTMPTSAREPDRP